MNTEKPLTHLLGQTSKLMKIKLRQSFIENNQDLTVEQYIILNMINNHDNLIQQELANHFQKDKSLILRQVEILLDKLLVARKTNEDDKRKKNLILTEKGSKTLATLRAISKAVSEELLTGISADDQKIFVSIIQKIQANTGFTCQSGKIN